DYDSIYTERYMLTPQDNPDGYDKSSVTKVAKDLRGRLLILHGSIDDNVHLQNTTQFTRALQEAAKPFEMMIYPGYRHGIFGKHYQREMLDFILKTVGTPGGTPSLADPTPTSGDRAATEPPPDNPDRPRRRGRGNGASRQ